MHNAVAAAKRRRHVLEAQRKRLAEQRDVLSKQAAKIDAALAALTKAEAVNAVGDERRP